MAMNLRLDDEHSALLKALAEAEHVPDPCILARVRLPAISGRVRRGAW
jgi:hypothetical protein